jgi:hypothetical protein
MMFNDDPQSSFYIETLSREHLAEVPKLAEFIGRKIATSHRTFSTSSDEDERMEVLEKITMFNASLLLLVLSSLTEDRTVLETSKTIYREATK